MNNYDEVKTNELYHYGVLGMRWGFRRFQPYSLIPRKSGKGGQETGIAKKNSKTPKSLLVSGLNKGKRPKADGNVPVNEVKKSRSQRSTEAKAEREAKTARQRKENIEKIINSGDINKVYEHRGELTTNQLNDAINRINTEAKVIELYNQANPTRGQKFLRATKNLADYNTSVDNIYKSYNNAARLINSFGREPADGDQAPYIQDASGKGNKRQKNKKKK